MTDFTFEEKNINPKDIFVINSTYFENDELIKYHLIHHKYLEYKCYDTKCPTKNGNWKRKKIYLILERINCKLNDLRIKNLRLICPNCYCQNKGPKHFEKYKTKIEKKCKYCNFIINNAYKTDMCYVCYQKLKNINYDLSSNEYIDLVTSLYEIDGNTQENKDKYYEINNYNSLENNNTIIDYKYHKKIKKHDNKTNLSSNLDLPDIKINTDIDEELLNNINKLCNE